MDAYQSLAHQYDARYAGAYWDVYDEVTLATALPYLPTGAGHVLDAGAGTGKFSLRLLERGWRVTLLDPSSAMLDLAREKIHAAGHGKRAEYIVSGIEDIDLPDGTFDSVFCEGDPLSYCGERYPEAARELVRVLRPGGGLYASCDSRWMAVAVRLVEDDAEGALAVAHSGASKDPYANPVRAFRPDQLKDAFAAAGLQAVRVRGTAARMGFPAQPKPAEPSRDPPLRQSRIEK